VVVAVVEDEEEGEVCIAPFAFVDYFTIQHVMFN
jgi:hypothetical protein